MTQRKLAKTRLALATLVVMSIFWLLPGRALGLSIQPLRQNLQLQPGQTVTKSLIVTNTTKSPETISVSATSFNTVDKQYNYAFGKPPDLSSWIQFIEDQVVIKPGEQHIFQYNVAVPVDAEPGGKYIAIFASLSSKPEASAKTQTVVKRAGSLIYLTVSGEQSKNGSLVSFSTPILTFSKNSSWLMQIQNKGNTHFNSPLNNSLHEWFGRKLGSSSETHLIMPGTIRELSGEYRLGNWPAIYRFQTTVGLGDNSTVQKSSWVLYLPPLPSLAIGAVILVVGTLMIRKLKLLKKYKLRR